MDHANRWAIITPICKNVQGVFESYRVVIKWGKYSLFRLNITRIALLRGRSTAPMGMRRSDRLLDTQELSLASVSYTEEASAEPCTIPEVAGRRNYQRCHFSHVPLLSVCPGIRNICVYSFWTHNYLFSILFSSETNSYFIQQIDCRFN